MNKKTRSNAAGVAFITAFLNIIINVIIVLAKFVYVGVEKIFSKKDIRVVKQANTENNTEWIKSPDGKTMTTVVKIDMNDIIANVKKSQARRERLLNNPPPALLVGAIHTIECLKKSNPNNLSKHPVYYVKGKVGSDYIEAFINSNQKSKYVPFYVNGPVRDVVSSKQTKGDPIYNLQNHEIRMVFEENEYMKDAIVFWIEEEYKKIMNNRSEYA